ncbi:MAG: xanthine dehydrogenase family protein subunit M [Planctomycetaceae bacterium]|nr:xanthine dehydrogenase family protein subunit M [Planctomycetaceae bacterium]
MRDFDFAAPDSLDAAVQLLAKNKGKARPLAGGTDLIDYLRTGRLSADLVVDLKRIPELNVLEVTQQGLRLGAAVPCYRIYEHPEIGTHFAALVDACSIIGGIQIQSRASVGGNLCTSGPAADSTPALIALGAQCVIASASGSRTLPVEQFCTGPSQNVLQPGEILQEVTIPLPEADSGSHYRRFIPRNEMDIAVVGVGASVTVKGGQISNARIGLGAVAPHPLFAEDVSNWIVNQPASDATYIEAGQRARKIISPIDDHRGTAEFRTHVTGVLVERVLREAVQRAESGTAG